MAGRTPTDAQIAALTCARIVGVVVEVIDAAGRRRWREPPRPDPERAAPDVTKTTPENQAATFRKQDQIWPVRAIRRGDTVRPLPPHARSLAGLTYELGGIQFGIDDFMGRRRAAGLLILKQGEIAWSATAWVASRKAAGPASRPRSR